MDPSVAVIVNVMVTLLLLLSVYSRNVVSVSTTLPLPAYQLQERQESDNSNVMCTTKEFFCPEGYCIPQSWMCDHYVDCQQADDEHNCPWSLTTARPESSRHFITDSISVADEDKHLTDQTTSTVHKQSTPVPPTTIQKSSTILLATPSVATSTSTSTSSTSTSTSTSTSNTNPSSTSQTQFILSTSTPSSSSVLPLSTTPQLLSTLFSRTNSTTATTSAEPGLNESLATTIRRCQNLKPFTCSTQMNGIARQISACWVCDGQNDCMDKIASDESNCSSDCSQLTEKLRRTCLDGQCISVALICNGQKDCTDGTDELGCLDCNSGQSQVRCLNQQQCINVSSWCNGQWDCADGTDEMFCGIMPCPQDAIRCNATNTCIASIYVCDNIAQCPDYADESNCTCSSHYGFRCQMGLCVNTGAWCNGVADCPDSSDEPHNCFQYCAPNMYQCDNGQCISQRDVCNGINTCGDYSDEHNCECEAFEFSCSDTGICMDIGFWCDGHINCPNGSDEPSNCSFSCPVKWVNCDNRCLSSVYVCDGIANCIDRSDESDCESISSSVVFRFQADLLIAEYKNTSRFLVCADGWSTDLSNLVCVNVGCKSLIATSSQHQINSNIPYLLSTSSLSLSLQPGLCYSNQAVNLKCSCSESIVAECGTGPLFSGNMGDSGQHISVDWPWHATLFSNDGYICSGVVVNRRWILTAGHCFTANREQASDLFVKLGSLNLWTRQQTMIKASDVIIHPELSTTNFTFDVALVRLVKRLTFNDDMHPVCVSSVRETNTESACVITQLGHNHYSDYLLSMNLISRYVRLMRSEHCHNITLRSVLCGHLQSNDEDTACLRNMDANLLICQQTPGHWTLSGIAIPEFNSSVLLYTHSADFVSWIQQTITSIPDI